MTKMGRKPKEIDLERLDTLLELGVPKTRIAKDLGIGRATLYRILEERVDISASRVNPKI